MSLFKKFDIDPVDVDADGISAAATPGAAGNLTLGGALTSGGTYTSGDGAARQISVTTAADDNARTLTITGTDADGRAQTETMTGSELNTTTTESSKYWATVTQIAIDDGAAGNISVGTVDELATSTYPLDTRSDIAATVALDVTGTISVTTQVTLENIQQTFTDQESIPWVSAQDTDLVTATADAIGNLSDGVSAVRFLVNSYSSGAEVQAYIRQPNGST